MGEGIQPGPFTFHLEVHSCTQTQDRFPKVVSFVVYEFPHGNFHVVIILNSYVCTHKKGGQAGIVTERTIFSCCPGHRYHLIKQVYCWLVKTNIVGW